MSAVTLPVLAAAALLTAGAVVGTGDEGTVVSPASGAAHHDHRGMMQMHEQMMADHPRMMQMHERMGGDAPCTDHE